MQALAVSPAPAHLADNQRQALISLLLDEDTAIYQMVRGQLLGYGDLACQWLRPHLLSDNPLMRRRAREIVDHLNRQRADQTFQSFCARTGEDLDFEEATHLLAQTRYPGANALAYRALYESWAWDLRERINATAEPEQILGVINRYLFVDLGFTGHDHHGLEPGCSYLNWVVDTRTGNPIGLCAVYLSVSRRLRLPVTGIGLPGHFVCRYQSSRKEIYIDAFQQGRFLTRNDCIKYLVQTHHGLQEGYLAPVSPRRMLLRMCANLHQTYARLEMTQEAARVHRYVIALTR